MTSPAEKWAHHPRHKVLVSTHGRVVIRGRLAIPSIHPGTGRPYIHRLGERLYLHHAVLETFVGPRPTPDHHALHADDDPMNNRLDNLRWGTRQDNLADRRANRPEGWAVTQPKLTEEQVREIRAAAAAGTSTNELSRTYGVAHSTMRKVLNRETWRHVE